MKVACTVLEGESGGNPADLLGIIFSGVNGIEERDVAEIATFTPEELREYEDSLIAYRGIKNSIDTARRGFSVADLSEMTGLSNEEINAL